MTEDGPHVQGASYDGDDIPQVSRQDLEEWTRVLMKADPAEISSERERLATLGLSDERELILMTLEKGLHFAEPRDDMLDDPQLLLDQLKTHTVLDDESFMSLLLLSFKEACQSFEPEQIKKVCYVLRHFGCEDQIIHEAALSALKSMDQAILDEWKGEGIDLDEMGRNLAADVNQALERPLPKLSLIEPSGVLHIPFKQSALLEETPAFDTSIALTPEQVLGSGLYDSCLLLQAALVISGFEHDQEKQERFLDELHDAMQKTAGDFLEQWRRGETLEGAWGRLARMLRVIDPVFDQLDRGLNRMTPAQALEEVSQLLELPQDPIGRIKAAFLTHALDRQIGALDPEFRESLADRLNALVRLFPPPLQGDVMLRNRILQLLSPLRELIEPQLGSQSRRKFLRELVPLLRQAATMIDEFLRSKTRIYSYMALPLATRKNAERAYALVKKSVTSNGMVAINDNLRPLSDDQLADAIQAHMEADENDVGWHLSAEIAKRWYEEFVGNDPLSTQINGWESGELRKAHGADCHTSYTSLKCRDYWNYLDGKLKLRPEQIEENVRDFLAERFPQLNANCSVRYSGKLLSESTQPGQMLMSLVIGRTPFHVAERLAELSRRTPTERARDKRTSEERGSQSA